MFSRTDSDKVPLWALVEQDIMYWIPMPGEDFKYMEERKEHPCTNHKEQKSKHFCPPNLGIEIVKEDTMQSNCKEQCFYSHAEETKQGQLQ